MRFLAMIIATCLMSAAIAADPVVPAAAAATPIDPMDLLNLTKAARLGLSSLSAHDLVIVSNAIDHIEGILSRLQASAPAPAPAAPAPPVSPPAATKKD